MADRDDLERTSQGRIILAFYDSIATGRIPQEVPAEARCRKCPRPHAPHYHLCAPCRTNESRAPAADYTVERLSAEATELRAPIADEKETGR